jgi:hypothetical protein
VRSEAFSGVIYSHQLRLTVGALIDELELVANAADPEDLSGAILFLPL